MGMRDSDARWIERDVIPLLESLGQSLTPTYGGSFLTRLAETTAQAKRRLGARQAPATAEVHRMGLNPAVEHYSADVDGQKVPYIVIGRWPCVWNELGQPDQVYPQIEFQETGRAHDVGGTTLPAYSYTPKVLWDGDWCWTVTVDGRFSFNFDSQEDVELVLPILAQGMAVAGGFTSHGPHSFPKNAHGPAVGLAPFTTPGANEPAMTQDMLIRWLESWQRVKADQGVATVKERPSEGWDEYNATQSVLSEMIESQRGNKTFPGWPFDLPE
jgi:hypothetical protein